MNFRPRSRSKPELNLIPLIDVLIVLLIFLVLTTTFSREAALHIHLPEASEHIENNDKGIDLTISAEGRYAVNGNPVAEQTVAALKHALSEAAGGNQDPLVTISADKSTQHQAVVTALDAAGQLGFVHVTFATQSAAK